MSKPIAPLDTLALETVTGGVTALCSGGNSLLNQLNGLASTIQQIGNASKSSGFSNTDILMLGLLLSQQNRATVVVRPRYWW